VTNETTTSGKKKVGYQATDNEGGAVFQFRDSATGVNQKFIFNLRYYKGASS